ncbi:MAG TPA: hypothetical protein VE869_00155 [Gemmatimonas sp.]|nr:hypothetical protein [Gemmatimonas sp.]
MINDSSPRRGFLGRLLAIAGGLGAPSAVAAAAEPRAVGLIEDAWTKRVRGKHRVIFHSHEPTGGISLRWAKTFLDTQKSSYALTDSDSTVVVGLNGKAIGLLFNDHMWAKYPIGATLGMPGSINPAGPAGSNEIAALVARGAILLVCQNSLRLSGQRFLPDAARGDASARSAFAQEAAANLIAGAETVPAMIVTLQQAQDLGCRYVYGGA